MGDFLLPGRGTHSEPNSTTSSSSGGRRRLVVQPWTAHGTVRPAVPGGAAASPTTSPSAALVPSVGSQVPGARHLGGPLHLPLGHHCASLPRGPSVLGPSTVVPFHQWEWEPLSGGLGQARSRLLVVGPELLTRRLREPSAGVGTWFPARGARQHSASSRGQPAGSLQESL